MKKLLTFLIIVFYFTANAQIQRIIGDSTAIGVKPGAKINLQGVVNTTYPIKGVPAINLNELTTKGQLIDSLSNYTPLEGAVLFVGKQNEPRAKYKTINEAINDANDSPTNTVTIVIYPGVYEENLVLIDRNINLIGFDKEKTIILDRTGDYFTPPLEVSGDFFAENLTFKSTSELATTPPAILSYAVHADFYGEGTTHFSNCNVISEQNAAFGIGLHQNQTFIIENCFLKKSGSYDGGSLYFHNSPFAESNQKLIVKNSQILATTGHSLKIDDARQDAGGLDINTTVSFYNNSFWSDELFGENNSASFYPSVDGGISGRINITRDSYGNSLKILNILYPLPFPINEGVENFSVTLRDGSGHIKANFFETQATDEAFIPTSFFVSNGSDNFIRKVSVNKVDTALNVYLKANIDGSNINSTSFRSSLGMPSGGETLQSITDRGATTSNMIDILALKVPDFDLTSDVDGLKWAENGVDYRMTIAKTSGNVGIGTTTPQNKLHINGGALSVSNEASYSAIFSNGSNNGVVVGYDDSNNIGHIGSIQPGIAWSDLSLNPNGGNVGISTGSINPSEKLEVNGNVKATSFIKTGGTSSQFLKADGSVDAVSYLPLTGGALTGKLNFTSGTTSNSSFKIPNGVAPTAPVSGDWWSLTTGLRTQTYDGTQTKDVIFDKANSVFAGLGDGMIATNNSGDLSVVPIADRLTTNVITKTANYTVTLSDVGANGEVLVRADATGGNITITLPVASTATGLNFIVKKTDSSVNTVTVSVASTIDGTSTKVYNTQYSGARITSNGTTYSITGGF